jgi:hypothetical protein
MSNPVPHNSTTFAIGATIGTDLHGNHCRLGATDTDGYTVGWINPNTGDCYASYHEYLCSVASGRYASAMTHYLRGERPRPDVETVIAAFCDQHACHDLHDLLVTDALADWSLDRSIIAGAHDDLLDL